MTNALLYSSGLSWPFPRPCAQPAPRWPQQALELLSRSASPAGLGWCPQRTVHSGWLFWLHILDFLSPGRLPGRLLLLVSINKYLLTPANEVLGSSECPDPAWTDSEAPRLAWMSSLSSSSSGFEKSTQAYSWLCWTPEARIWPAILNVYPKDRRLCG